MAGEDRSARDPVTLYAELARSPHQFDFFQVLRLLECAHPDRARLGRSQRASEDPVRLGQHPSMEFAPRTLASFRADPQQGPPRLDVFFLGLFGPNGPLPLHLTDYARQRIHNEHDHTFARFCDIFHHRLLSLFYRARADTEPAIGHDRPESNRFGTYLASLMGLGMPSLRQREVLPDEVKLGFTGLLADQTRNAEGLEAILSHFFRQPMAIRQLIGHWLEVPGDERCRLGGSARGSTLGVALTVGARVWDCQTRFRIECGPLSLEEYRRFLPGGESLPYLIDLVNNYVGFELQWELQLQLRREEVPPLSLGRTGQIGWSSWLSSHPPRRDPADLRFCPLDERAD